MSGAATLTVVVDNVRLAVEKSFDGYSKGSDEPVALDAKATIKETADFWVIEKNVITKDGVFNNLLRDERVLRDAWMLYEGVPITHGHPPDIVRGLDEVAGIVRNVRLEDREGGGVRILADYHLAKHVGVPGLKVTARLIEKNEAAVDRVRKSKRLDNSQGFLFRAIEETGSHGGRKYAARAEALVPNHLAILLDQEGACNWTDGCGVGRLAGEAERKPDEGHSQSLSPMADGKPDAPKTETPPAAAPAQETVAKSALDAAQNETKVAREAVASLLGAAGLPADTPIPSAVESFKSCKAELDTIRKAKADAHKALAGEVAALALPAKEAAAEKAKATKPTKESLTKGYESWSTEALVEHKAVLEAALSKSPQRTDQTRIAGEAEDAAEDNRPMPGVPTLGADGVYRYNHPKVN